MPFICLWPHDRFPEIEWFLGQFKCDAFSSERITFRVQRLSTSFNPAINLHANIIHP